MPLLTKAVAIQFFFSVSLRLVHYFNNDKTVPLMSEPHLTDVDEVRLLQVHVELDEDSEHLVTELLILHKRHADLQAVGKESADIVLRTTKNKTNKRFVKKFNDRKVPSTFIQKKKKNN